MLTSAPNGPRVDSVVSIKGSLGLVLANETVAVASGLLEVDDAVLDAALVVVVALFDKEVPTKP